MRVGSKNGKKPPFSIILLCTFALVHKMKTSQCRRKLHLPVHLLRPVFRRKALFLGDMERIITHAFLSPDFALSFHPAFLQTKTFLFLTYSKHTGASLGPRQSDTLSTGRRKTCVCLESDFPIF